METRNACLFYCSCCHMLIIGIAVAVAVAVILTSKSFHTKSNVRLFNHLLPNQFFNFRAESRHMNRNQFHLGNRASPVNRDHVKRPLGGVYMIPKRLSSRREFTPVPSYGSVFIYMIPPQNVMPARVIPARVHPGSCAGARFSSRHKNSFRCHVNVV